MRKSTCAIIPTPRYVRNGLASRQTFRVAVIVSEWRKVWCVYWPGSVLSLYLRLVLPLFESRVRTRCLGRVVGDGVMCVAGDGVMCVAGDGVMCVAGAIIDGVASSLVAME